MGAISLLKALVCCLNTVQCGHMKLGCLSKVDNVIHQQEGLVMRDRFIDSSSDS